MNKGKTVELVLAAQNGDENANAALFELYYDDIYYFILKTVKDTELAADLTQDTFVEILQTIGSLKEPAAFVSWSRQISYHKCTAYFRRRKDILADEDEDGNSVFDTLVEDKEEFIPDEALEKDEFKKAINAMIDGLPEDQRAAIMLRYFNELSIKEIAEIQNVSEGTVKSRLSYARASIKGEIEKYEKKSGVKLHAVGVVPLLLWLFRQTRLAQGVPLSSSIASATTASAAVAAEAAASTVESAAIGATVKSTAFGAIKTKIIAGVVATAVVAGGIAAAVVSSFNTNDEHVSEVESAENSEKSNTWVGYGTFTGHAGKNIRFEFEVTSMEDTDIKGHLNVSYLYKTIHDTDFTGTGELKDGKITYDITYNTPCYPSFFDIPPYEEIVATYDKETDTFTFASHYNATVERIEGKGDLLAENQTWTGVGDDLFSETFDHSGRDFEFSISEMTDYHIAGTLTVSYKGTVVHKSRFTGRGFKYLDYNKRELIDYEVSLETIRVNDTVMGTFTLDCFWLTYSFDDDTLQMDYYYDVIANKNKT